jgi:hypothetical protein
VVVNALDGASTLTFAHTGTSGVAAVQVPQLIIALSAGAPSSALTAGTAGQMLTYENPSTGIAELYFCTVGGVAGSASWIQLSGTAV